MGRPGARRVKARDYYLGIYETEAQPGEILTEIRVPIPSKPHGFAYEKLKRKIGDYATAAAAVILTVSGGRVASCAIGLTNVADRPLLATEAAEAAVGSALDKATLARAAAAAEAIASPAEDGRGSRRISRQDGRDHDRASARTRLRPRRIVKRPAMPKINVAMTVNGKLVSAEVEPRTLLIHFLRENLSLTGPHIGCDTTHCGACTVDVDSKSVKSCTMFAVQAQGADILTIEGMAAPDGKLHALQEGFREMHGLQCGYCTPGMIMRAHRLLQENPNPSEAEIRFGISGNLCRCTGYQNIVKAIQYAAAKLNGIEFREAAE